jgi:hypothetical protein
LFFIVLQILFAEHGAETERQSLLLSCFSSLFSSFSLLSLLLPTFPISQ